MILLVTVCLYAVSCSTTKVLSEGEYLLAKNSVTIMNSDQFNGNSLNQYIKQTPNQFIFGWNPFLSIYNWADADDNSPWARFCRKIGKAPVIYNPEAVESTIENMENHLKYLGYYNSVVGSDIHLERKKVNVNYEVTLGKRYRIDSLSFTIPERGPFKEDFLADSENVTVKVGDYLSEASLEEETQRGAEHFRDIGYYGFTKNYYVFEADTVSVPGKLFLEMKVNEYTRNENADNADVIRKFHIDSVTISHSKDLVFKDKVLTQLNMIRPGDLYSESSINRTYTRLSALKTFNSVNIEMNRTDTSSVNCAINLSQSHLQGFKANLEASSNSSGLMGISPQLSVFHKNIFHGGEWLNLSFMGNFQFKLNNDQTHSNEFGVSAGLSLPRFLGLPYSRFGGGNIPRTEINASYNYQNRPEYTRNTISTSFGYSGTIQNGLSYQFYPLQLNVVHLGNMDDGFFQTLSRNPFMKYAYQDHFDAGLGGSMQYTTNNETNPSVSYSYVRLSGDLSGNVLSLFNRFMKTNGDGTRMIWGTPYSQYLRAELTLGRTFRFGSNGKQAVATRALLGFGRAYGNSSALPFEKQFYSGGANSMRGWQARTLGPGASMMNDSFIIPSQTGDMKMEFNAEYRFNLVWKLDGALFVDAGNIWTINQGDSSTDFSFNDLHKSIAADWGTGVRVDLSFLILRVDLGMKLYDPSQQRGWLKPEEWVKRDGFAVHFGVGYPF